MFIELSGVSDQAHLSGQLALSTNISVAMSSIRQIETLLEEQARRIGTLSPPITRVLRTEGILTFEE